MTAVVEGNRHVAMKDVRVGDRVLTASGQYQQIYTINHMHGSKPTKYVQIQSTLEDEEPLELTGMHMVFVEHSKVPIPAAKVKIGDSVRTKKGEFHKVTKVTTVTRNGLYSPQTTDGTIVVNGVIASTYCSFLGSEYIEFGGYQFMSTQSFLHLAMTPVRALCSNGYACTFESQTVEDSFATAKENVEAEKEELMDGYTKAGLSLLQFSVEQPSLFQIIVFMGLLIVFTLLAFTFSPFGFIILLFIVYRLMTRRKIDDTKKYAPLKTVDMDMENSPKKTLDV